MEEQDTRKEREELENKRSFVDLLISMPSNGKRSDETKKLFEELMEKGEIDANSDESEENKCLKTQYIKAILIFDDLNFYNQEFANINGQLDSLCRFMQFTKNSFLPLALLRSNINGWGRYHIDDARLSALRDTILPGLEFANHVRNKISGHIESEVVDNSVQWEPTVFQDKIKDLRSVQKLLIYRAILESAVNSYVDPKTGSHKIFDQEIDVIFPDTSYKFFNYIQGLIRDSLNYLELLIEKLDMKIVYFHGVPANLIKNAAETDFKTKNKGR